MSEQTKTNIIFGWFPIIFCSLAFILIGIFYKNSSQHAFLISFSCLTIGFLPMIIYIAYRIISHKIRQRRAIKNYSHLVGQIYKGAPGKECMQIVADGILWVDHHSRLEETYQPGNRYKIVKILGTREVWLELTKD